MSATLMGQRPENTTARKVELGVWRDTPYFAPGMEEDSENMRAFPVGASLVGRLVEIQTIKSEVKGQGDKVIARCETTDGEKFRVRCQGNLESLLRAAGHENPVEIIYRGKEEVEGYAQPLHQFEVNILETSH